MSRLLRPPSQDAALALFAKDPAALLDQTLLAPMATEEAHRAFVEEALPFGFASLCVASSRVSFVRSLIGGRETPICAVVGFPHGNAHTAAKIAEARAALDEGARELDFVAHRGFLADSDVEPLRREWEAIVACRPQGVIFKMILEAAELSPEELQSACRHAMDAGFDFVKTSTGFGKGGASEQDVRVMRAVVGQQCGVKASGGVRDRSAVTKMIKAGADRIGTSSGPAIVEENRHG